MSDPCQKVKRHLSAYVDHELDASHRQLVEKHLPSCADCQAQLNLLQNAGAVLKASLEQAPADDFVDQVFRHVMNAEEKRGVLDLWGSLFPIAVPSAAAACVLAVALVGFTKAVPPQDPSIHGNTHVLLASTLKTESQALGDVDSFLLASYGLEEDEEDGMEEKQ
jgi:anti-sigma factor RsiW